MELSRQEQSASLIASFIISSPIVASFLSSIFNINFSGIAVIACIYVLLLRHIIKYKLYIRKNVALFIGYLLLVLFVSSLMFDGHGDELFLQFVEYGLLGLLAGAVQVNSKDTLDKCIHILLVLSIPCFLLIQTGATNKYSNDINMGLTYGMMPLVFAVITHFSFYRKKATLLNKISYIIALVLLALLLYKGTRGIWVCLVVLLYFIYLNKTNYSNSASTSKVLFSFLLVIVISLVLINYEYVLVAISNFLSTLGVDVRFLDKSLLLITNGDLSNGRTKLYELAWNGFIRSPIVGNGVGAFSDNYSVYGYAYIHNMILQILYELGLVFGLPIIFYIISPLKTMVFNNNAKKDLSLLIVLYASSVPMLMLSSELWLNRQLWLMIGYYLSNIATNRQ